jgi:hypothetical protein
MRNSSIVPAVPVCVYRYRPETVMSIGPMCVVAATAASRDGVPFGATVNELRLLLAVFET